MIDISVTKVTDHPDGSATIEMEMDEHTLFFLAKIGMMHLIEEAAGKVLDEDGHDGGATVPKNSFADGPGNISCGPDRGDEERGLTPEEAPERE